MNFYKVDIFMPVLNASYYVVANSMGEAGELALARDHAGGGTSGGVTSVHLICEYTDEGALIVGDGA